jgi:hypothetical protein
LTSTTIFNGTHRPTEGTQGFVFHGSPASPTDNATFEDWIAILTSQADEQHQETRIVRSEDSPNAPRESRLPLQKLKESPWRSLGGYFDYSDWPERDRFMELDKAIASSQDSREPDIEPEIEMI